MTPFHSFTMVKHPVDQIWLVMRDHLAELAVQLDDLDSIVQLERSTGSDGRLLLVNRWQARQTIPAMLRGALGGEVISWVDRAQWDDTAHVCEWAITPSVLSDHIDCRGSTRYEPAMAGRGTRVSFDGSFTLKPGFLNRLPAAFEPAILSLVENIVSTLIPRNLSKAINAAGQFSAAQAPGQALAPPASP
ncbi:hypothetical protein IV454_19060 [Massilia antarctica]|uniref:Cyclase n=1 Tax=Massilia antarctica TaxID=2765360 RepID=A0AA48W9Z3_9BURK|nr:hypothetical protein [Massilia antarctica]QPI47684.1 hypothetical protein IV454_19060 [Massilia antarctica]